MLARADIAQQVRAEHELHHHEEAAIFFHQLEQLDQVVVTHVLQRTKLVLQIKQRVGAGALQSLERHADLAGAIARFVHAAHAATSQVPNELEATRASAAETGRCRSHAVRLLCEAARCRVAPAV